jgi:hypothetical protein
MKLNAKLVASLQLERSAGKSRLISRSLRMQLIAEVRRARGSRASAAQVASAYGLSVPTIYAWLREPQTFLPVHVTRAPEPAADDSQASTSALCVHDPRSGLCVFGCTLDQVATLLAVCR